MTILNLGAGNSLASATSLNLGFNTLQVTGNLVNVTAAAADFYKLNLSRSSLNLSLNTLTANANVDFELIASNGTTVLSQSGNTGSLTDLINLPDLAAGTYYLRVFTNGATSADYRLNFAGNAKLSDDSFGGITVPLESMVGLTCG